MEIGKTKRKGKRILYLGDLVGLGGPQKSPFVLAQHTIVRDLHLHHLLTP